MTEAAICKMAKDNLELRAQVQRLEAEFKNFHRSLCARFEYWHDEVDWKRDQLSLEEHIANKIKGLEAEVARMREALSVVHKMRGHHHWDHTMQHGAGCKLCILQGEIMKQVDAALAPAADEDAAAKAREVKDG